MPCRLFLSSPPFLACSNLHSAVSSAVGHVLASSRHRQPPGYFHPGTPQSGRNVSRLPLSRSSFPGPGRGPVLPWGARGAQDAARIPTRACGWGSALFAQAGAVPVQTRGANGSGAVPTGGGWTRPMGSRCRSLPAERPPGSPGWAGAAPGAAGLKGSRHGAREHPQGLALHPPRCPPRSFFLPQHVR